MAFPQYIASVTGDWTSVENEYVSLDFSGLTISAGDLIVVHWAATEGTGVNVSGKPCPGLSWNYLATLSRSGEYYNINMWGYADSSANLAFQLTVPNVDGVYVIHQIRSGFAPNPNSTNSTGTPLGPAATGSDGSLDYLYVKTVVTVTDDVADAAPTSYSNLVTKAGASSGQVVSISSANRQLASTSESSSTFDFSSSAYNDWFAGLTFSVSPKSRLYLNDAVTESLEWNGTFGHNYQFKPWKANLPVPYLNPSVSAYSGKLTPESDALPILEAGGGTLGQNHALQLPSTVTLPTLATGLLSAVDNDNISSEKFMFAWVGADETSFGAAHQRNDENVFSFSIDQTEGDFATLTVDVVNPRVGLLGPSRKRWAWLSWNTGAGIEALFFGRLVGVPQSLEGEIVRLQFVARPQGYEATKEALADTLRVAPGYDPMWYSEEARLDPDVVLEGRPELWNIDRVTHEVTTTNILVGEDGTVDFGTNHFYDGMTVSYSQAPGRIARVKATVAWRQKAEGYLDISSKFPARIETYTHTGLLNDWPDPDQDIGGGWTVWDVSNVRLDRDYPKAMITKFRLDATTYKSLSIGTLDPESTTFYVADGSQVLWYRAKIKPFMVLKYDVEREYAEVATFDLEADVQPLLTEPGDDEILQITMSCNADDPVDPQTGSDELAAPIGDLASHTFFHQDRGRESLEHVVSVARAQLMARARVVDLSCQVPFALATEINCRKNVSLDDGRLPGGTASGKVKSYSLVLDGDTGEAVGYITIGATIGNGGSVSDAEGTPRYVETGYVDTGWQAYSDAATSLASGDLTIGDYSDIDIADDGIRFDTLTPNDAVVDLQIINDADDQEAYVGVGGLFSSEVPSKEITAELFNEVYTEIFLDVADLVGPAPFETQFPITLSLLKLPKTIDLEAT